MIWISLLPVVTAASTLIIAGAVMPRLRPNVAAALGACATVVTFVVLTAAAWTISIAYLAHVPALSPVVGWCSHLLGSHSTPPTALGFAALASVVWSTWRVGSIVLVWHRERSRAESGVHILDSDDCVAFAEPGARGGIVISTALLGRLSAEEKRAVLFHERSHIEHRHDRYLVVSSLFRGIPPFRGAVQEMQSSLERWADSAAAEKVGDPRVVARAIARTGLASTQPKMGSHMGSGDVTARIHALTSPQPIHRSWVLGGSLLVATDIATGAAALRLLAPIVATICHI